jgi:hypothetical protein
MGAMRHLMAGGVFVTVDGDHLHAQPLQRNDHFLAEFAGAEQHDALGSWGKAGCRFSWSLLGA